MSDFVCISDTYLCHVPGDVTRTIYWKCMHCHKPVEIVQVVSGSSDHVLATPEVRSELTEDAQLSHLRLCKELQ